MFDPYHKWLGIPKDQRPPTYYQLLGIAEGESDPEVIEEAAVRQTAHVRTYQIGKHAAVCTRVLNEIAEARLTLLNPAKRRAYDEQLARAKATRSAAAGAVAVGIAQGVPPSKPDFGLDDDAPPLLAPRRFGVRRRRVSGALMLWLAVAAAATLAVAVGIGIAMKQSQKTDANRPTAPATPPKREEKKEPKTNPKVLHESSRSAPSVSWFGGVRPGGRTIHSLVRYQAVRRGRHRAADSTRPRAGAALPSS
ncbi:MAG: hypothetical protein NZO58_07710 [Gemmataceae bacterium]|nr:hypothetical protein [Gemmataceae bacterium]